MASSSGLILQGIGIAAIAYVGVQYLLNNTPQQNAMFPSPIQLGEHAQSLIPVYREIALRDQDDGNIGAMRPHNTRILVFAMVIGIVLFFVLLDIIPELDKVA